MHQCAKRFKRITTRITKRIKKRIKKRMVVALENGCANGHALRCRFFMSRLDCVLTITRGLVSGLDCVLIITKGLCSSGNRQITLSLNLFDDTNSQEPSSLSISTIVSKLALARVLERRARKKPCTNPHSFIHLACPPALTIASQ